METNFPMDNADEHMKFKSYYVVWKQQENKDFLLPRNLFKSYYVVWKRKTPNDIRNISLSLNRTM